MSKQRTLQYRGGKQSQLKWLLPLLPNDCQTYVEPFGGSAAVLLNRYPSPVEVYNDLDGSLVAFFRALRDNPSDLIWKIRKTPISREMYVEAIENYRDESLSDVERGYYFFVATQQSFGALCTGLTEGRWGYNFRESRRGKGKLSSRWQTFLDELCEIEDRMRDVQIESRPAVDVIERVDREDCLIYCDPPYIMEERSGTAVYENEMESEMHSELISCLKECDADVAISNYMNGMYDSCFEDWFLTTENVQARGNTEGRSTKTEALWTNYDPDNVTERKVGNSAMDW